MEQHREEVFVYIQNSKMKLGLLTFHNAANYGASLQAYALQKFLADKGYDCEYINYVNVSRGHEYSMTWHILDSLRHGKLASAAAYMAGSPFLTLRKVRFNKFYSHYLKKTEKVYHTSDEAVELNGKYNRFIVGSDQVWNPACNGDDAAFLLDFVKNNRERISYSSSFGVAIIDDKHRDVFKANLSAFHALAVRESIGRDLIKELTGRDAQVVLDPVMLLTKEQWMQLVPDKQKNERFIFSYTNRDSQITDFFKTGYKLEYRKHYILSRYTRPQDFISPTSRVKYCMSPQEFVSVIANADLVVSASFHCLAMSIILNRPFVAILTGDKGKDERPLNILRALNLEDRILNPSMTEAEVNAPIDWNSVNKKIEELKASSVAYLDKAINE